MASPRTQRIVAFSLSVVGHALIVVALTFSVSLSSPERPMGVIVPIQTVMVDQAVLDARAAEIEAERQAVLQRQREEAQRVQREEQQRQQRAAEAERAKIQLEAERRAEAERLALLEEERIQREADEARQREEEARRQEEEARRIEQERIARERAEAERRRREEEAQRQRDQIAAEIAAAAAAEQQARDAANSGERDRWAAMISNRVQQNWQRPLNATAGLECLLIVEQVITGEVRSVTVSECNVSDANIIRSLENAVHASSPLPARPPGVEFERIVRIRFKPVD
jgi:colicin import membrane protein